MFSDFIAVNECNSLEQEILLTQYENSLQIQLF